MIDEFRGKHFFLSNFYDYGFTYDGRKYMNAEAAFQSMKAPQAARGRYSMVPPNVAKRMGRRERLPDNWDEASESIMLDVLHAKFSDERLARLLLETGNEELVEGNTWHDNNWGNCTCEKCKSRPGKNRLGKLLMKVRDEIRKGEKNK